MKVLGTLALIDEGETDWKVIVINTDDPDADIYNSRKKDPSGVAEKINRPASYGLFSGFSLPTDVM